MLDFSVVRKLERCGYKLNGASGILCMLAERMESDCASLTLENSTDAETMQHAERLRLYTLLINTVYETLVALESPLDETLETLASAIREEKSQPLNQRTPIPRSSLRDSVI